MILRPHEPSFRPPKFGSGIWLREFFGPRPISGLHLGSHSHPLKNQTAGDLGVAGVAGSTGSRLYLQVMRTICLIVEEWNADQVVNDFEENLGSPWATGDFFGNARSGVHRGDHYMGAHFGEDQTMH